MWCLMSTRGMLEVCQTLYTPYILCPCVFFSFLYHLLLYYASFRLCAAVWLRSSLFLVVCLA